MAKKETRRAVKVTFQDGEERTLEISRVVEVCLTSGKQFVYLDRRADGKWMLTYTRDTFPNDRIGVERIEVIREDADEPAKVTARTLRNIYEQKRGP